MFPFVSSPVTTRLIALVTGCVIMATAGSMYSFGVFTDAIRSRFQMTSSDVNIINAVGNAAVYISYLVIGPIYDAFGDRVTSALGLVTYGLGYLLMWASFQGHILGSNTTTLSIFYFLAGFGSSCGYVAAIGVNLTNYSSNYSGIISGIMLLFFGLSGTIYAQIYATLFSKGNSNSSDSVDTSGFLLFMAISVIVSNGLGIVGLLKSPPQRISNAIEPTQSNVDSNCPQNEGKHQSEIVEYASPEKTSTYTGQDDCEKEQSGKSIPANTKEPHEEYSMTPIEILKSPLFWVYANATVWQQGLTYMSNVTTILRSVVGVNMDETWIVKTGAAHVTILSVGQTVSRFSFAILSDILQARFGLDRSVLLIVANTLGILPLVILGIFPEGLQSQALFVTCSLFVGLAWGGSGALFPLLTKELFGVKHYGTAMGFVLAGCPINFFVSNLIFGSVYDSALNAQIQSGGHLSQCYGTTCFQKGFLITMFIHVLPVLLSVILFLLRAKSKRYRAVPAQ